MPPGSAHNFFSKDSFVICLPFSFDSSGIMVLGKVRALAIYFDSLNENNLPVFSGGDLVSGRVVVEVTGDVRVKSLDIHARGVAKVRWTESRNAGANTTYTQNYTEEVEYLHHYDTLIGEERGENVVSQCVWLCVCVRAAMQQNFCPSEFFFFVCFFLVGGTNFIRAAEQRRASGRPRDSQKRAVGPSAPVVLMQQLIVDAVRGSSFLHFHSNPTNSFLSTCRSVSR